MAATVTRNPCFVRGLSAFVWQCRPPNTTLSLSKTQLRWKGHSEWQNRKYKKAHIDFARSKEFGKLSLEIITATKDNPFETVFLEIKGPGGCGLLVQLLTTNKVKAKYEMNRILRRKGGVSKEAGSVPFLYNHKGTITIEDFLFTEEKRKLPDYPDNESIERAEEIAIECGVENLFFSESENGTKNIKFICALEDVKQVYNDLSNRFPDRFLSSEQEYLPRKLVSLSEEPLQQAKILIDSLEEHLDVVRVYDNIKEFPSHTCKLFCST
ncbi:hypothetical protein pdam_00015318 [Pocillopora damicornis]|uniref:TACO1/YebC-like second and third domain-containing protein n=1 Tax=Pocillopora damicornis TaxID=46731 RepID=A0A3M6U755_POCDA|nr:hypothetical protein pdam_00015318 [Pocillopora damicornis]